MANIDRLAGKWRIIHTDAWDRRHLELCGPAYIEIDAHGLGDLAFGALEACVDSGFTPNGIDFKWSGGEEGDHVSGTGWADLPKMAALRAKSPTIMGTKLHSSPNLGLFQQPAMSICRNFGVPRVDGVATAFRVWKQARGSYAQGAWGIGNEDLGRGRVFPDRISPAGAAQS